MLDELVKGETKTNIQLSTHRTDRATVGKYVAYTFEGKINCGRLDTQLMNRSKTIKTM